MGPGTWKQAGGGQGHDLSHEAFCSFPHLSPEEALQGDQLVLAQTVPPGCFALEGRTWEQLCQLHRSVRILTGSLLPEC